jgi:hypothetical protein
MAILSKGYTFGSTEQVTSAKLSSLVDSASFVSGPSGTCASGGGLEVTGGNQLQILNGGVTSTKLSTGAPTWTSGGDLTVYSGGNFTCGGTGTFGGTISTSNDLSVNGIAAITGAISIGNTVNTVSPTSPDRTITIVVGGTTYYLHAKTTND